MLDVNPQLCYSHAILDIKDNLKGSDWDSSGDEADLPRNMEALQSEPQRSLPGRGDTPLSHSSSSDSDKKASVNKNPADSAPLNNQSSPKNVRGANTLEHKINNFETENKTRAGRRSGSRSRAGSGSSSSSMKSQKSVSGAQGKSLSSNSSSVKSQQANEKKQQLQMDDCNEPDGDLTSPTAKEAFSKVMMYTTYRLEILRILVGFEATIFVTASCTIVILKW